jgi:hypothetical protein
MKFFPDSQGSRRSAKRNGSITDFIGMLSNRTQKIATIDEINEAAARGWAGLNDSDAEEPSGRPAVGRRRSSDE